MKPNFCEICGIEMGPEWYYPTCQQCENEQDQLDKEAAWNKEHYGDYENEE